MPRLTRSKQFKTYGTTKAGCESPIYASSTGQREISHPRRRDTSMAPVTNDHTLTSYPTDRAALRALYQSKYPAYIAGFSKMVEQRNKIEAVLQGDEDAEADLLENGELLNLASEHKVQRKELEYIYDLYMNGPGRTTGGGSASA